MADLLVSLAAIFGIFIVPIAGWVAVRYLAHRERLEMIRHGMVPPVGKVRGRDWRNAASAAPAGVPPVMTPAQRNACDADVSLEGARIALRKGIRLSFIGLAITIGLSFIGYSDSPIGPMWHPGPWLLGGLIPLFIGLAQVTTALLSGAMLGIGPTWRPTPPPPFPDSFGLPPNAAPPTYDSSYTYRPGDTQELRPPPYPPERR
jgi:hypothetical protein